ncbi:TPA: hypothetical protein PMC50_002518 [Vibrio cholerae]|nr:hypothetical protein [Vibrio cholerae]
MAIQSNKNQVTGLKEVEALLDSLVDPKFRAKALREAGRKAMTPVKQTLISNIPSSSSPDDSSYKHYGEEGYSSGDLKQGVKLQVIVNSNKDVKSKNTGLGGKQSAELITNLTFDKHLYKLAGILEHGRTKRIAKTRNGNVFHSYGKPTDSTQRDIGTFEGKHFVSKTFAQCEGKMVADFKRELIQSIQKQSKAMAKKGAK